MSKKSRLICACCEGEIGIDEPVYYGDEKTYYEGKPLCEACYFEDEPVARVYYGRDNYPHIISLTRNETEGDFWVKWRSTDPWRGYYEVYSDVFSRIFSDTILAYHESEQMLKDLNDRLIELYSEKGIEFARVFTRTSNVFSTGFDFWVRKEPGEILKACLILEQVKREVNYDDPVYSTGILFDRETFRELQRIFSGKYQIRNEMDLLKLVSERGEDLVKEILESRQK